MRLSSTMDPLHRYRLAFLLPIERLQESPWRGFGPVVVVVEILLGAPAVVALLLLVLASAADYILGTRIAELRGERDPHVARAGLLGKGAAVALVLLVWMMEAGLWQIATTTGVTPPPWMVGVLAAALALVYTLDEVDSFDKHRQTLTGRPTPILRPILNLLRSVIGRLFPAPPGDR